MFLAVLFMVQAITFVDALDRKLFSVDPLPDPDFTIDRWSGQWYVQARYVPSSFIGSVEFTDFQFKNIPTDRKVVSYHSWRDGPTGECAGANFFAFYTKIPGVFRLKDTIGNVYSGDWVVPVLDSKLGLDVSWGCTKRALDGRCADPWASVKTRLRHPPPSLLRTAEKYLLKLFGLTLAEMEHVPQLKSC